MSNRRITSCAGFTLVELMAAVTISLVVILLLYSIFDKVQNVFVRGQAQAVVMDEGRSAMDMMVSDFRFMGPVAVPGTKNITWEGSLPGDWMNGLGANEHYAWGKDLTDSSFGIDNNASGHAAVFDAVTGPALRCFNHDISFFTSEEKDIYRYTRYKLASSSDYNGTLAGTPVGALWIYRSRRVLKDKLPDELGYHVTLAGLDASKSLLDEPVAYGKLVDGVIHFRVRALSKGGKQLGAYIKSANPFSGNTSDDIPTHVEIELAVLERKLFREVQGRLEDIPGSPVVKRKAIMEFLAKNIDRVYFFKQLVKIKKGG